MISWIPRDNAVTPIVLELDEEDKPKTYLNNKWVDLEADELKTYMCGHKKSLDVVRLLMCDSPSDMLSPTCYLNLNNYNGCLYYYHKSII